MKQLLIIGFVWPEPTSSAAGSRMLQLIDTFLQENYQITFVTTATQTEKAFPLENLDVKTHSIKLNDSSFDDLIKKLQPEIVLFDRFLTEEQFGWRVVENCPKAFRILDTEDLHGLRKGRQLALKDDKPFDKNYLFNDTSKREIASIFRCDLSLIISETEITLLKNDFNVPDALIHYLPFMLDELTPEITNKLPRFNNRKHFITIGNFLHAPNYDAVLFLKESIWPLIRKQLPKAELHIYGAYECQKVTQLHNENEGFLIKGFAENVNQVMQQAKICLAPLRFGAGLKGKLIDAMQNGTPCIMTTIAAEGMFGNLKANGFIEDNSNTFADNAITLYNDESLWEDKHKLGFNCINKRFQKVDFDSKLIAIIKKTQNNLESNRQHNFIGQMLQHQSMQSTKYMSKWIEEKNNK